MATNLASVAGPPVDEDGDVVAFCGQCGDERKLRDLQWSDDPYEADVNNTPGVNEGWWCIDCIQDRRDEI